MNLLEIEDDATTADYAASGLRQKGHVVDVDYDGRDGLFQASTVFRLS